VVESDLTVHQATYGYRAQDHSETERA
jgi:hypothetical protein